MNNEPLVFTNPTDHLPFKQRLGRCYELAGQIVLQNKGVSLIHGSIQGFNCPRMPHAWVEFQNGAIWEPSTNRIWTESAFAGFFNPRITEKYAHHSALEHFIRHENYGAWPQELTKVQSPKS